MDPVNVARGDGAPTTNQPPLSKTPHSNSLARSVVETRAPRKFVRHRRPHTSLAPNSTPSTAREKNKATQAPRSTKASVRCPQQTKNALQYQRHR